MRQVQFPDIDKAPRTFGQDKCPYAPGPSACPSSDSQDNQPARKMLEDELIQGKQPGTYSTLSFSPHLSKPHPYGGGVSHELSRSVHSFLSSL